MCLFDMCNKVALRWRVALVYTFPFVYCCLLLIVLGIIPAAFSTYPLLSASCLIFAFLNLLTGAVGLFGVFRRVDAALRGTVVLLVMENLMLLFVALFFLFSAVYRSLPAGLRANDGPTVKSTAWLIPRDIYGEGRKQIRGTGKLPGLRWMSGFLLWGPDTKWWFLLIASTFLVLSTTLTMCCLWAVADFQAELDADSFINDARHLREGERIMLLQTCKGYKHTVGEGKTPQNSAC